MSLPADNIDSSISLPTNVLGGVEAVEFSNKVRTAAESGVKKLVVDMSNVEVMNSSGLGMLVAALSTMRKFGGAITFVSVPDKVMTLLKMTHLDSVFDISSSTNASDSKS